MNRPTDSELRLAPLLEIPTLQTVVFDGDVLRAQAGVLRRCNLKAVNGHPPEKFLGPGD